MLVFVVVPAPFNERTRVWTVDNFLPAEDLARILGELESSWNDSMSAVQTYDKLRLERKRKEREERKMKKKQQQQQSLEKDQAAAAAEAKKEEDGASSAAAATPAAASAGEQQPPQPPQVSEEENAARVKSMNTDWLYTCNELNSNKKVEI